MGLIYNTSNGTEIRINTKDHNPPHVHVWKAGANAKIEIINQTVISNHGFSGKEIKLLKEFISERQTELMEYWNEIQKDQA